MASGRISRSQFARDSKGYGLAQWTYYTRKEDLYDYWNGSGKALDDAGMQVSFAVQELSENGEYAGLWNVLKTTDDIWTAADKVCRLYERPYYNNVEARYQYALQLKAELDLVGDIFREARRSGACFDDVAAQNHLQRDERRRHRRAAGCAQGTGLSGFAD